MRLARPPVEHVLIVLLLASVTAVAALTLVLLRQPEPFDPIEFSPTPRPVETATGLVPVIDGLPGPGVRSDERVPTTGVLCVDTTEPIEIVGNLWWERVDERGHRVQVIEGLVSELRPGCVDLEFANPIPDEISNQIDGPQQWNIHGDATPLAAGGVTATWRIEPFWIVP